MGFTFADQMASQVARRLEREAKVLDLGCGFGAFVIAARRFALRETQLGLLATKIIFLGKVMLDDEAKTTSKVAAHRHSIYPYICKGKKPYMKLLIIIPDPLSSLVTKGEITPRYYNPGELSDEVHILMTNRDKVDPADVQETVGAAQLYLHNLPEEEAYIQKHPLFKPWLLKHWAKPGLQWLSRHQFQLLDKWAEPAVALAEEIKPDLIRCHGNDYNAYAAARIKKRLGIPYVVSLHCNPDTEPRRRLFDSSAWNHRLFNILFDQVEVEGLRHADLILPVYETIVPYVQRVGCSQYQVAYNVLNSDTLSRKDDYTLHDPVRLVSVGRLFDLKNPENIIRAVSSIPRRTQLDLYGDGPYRERLEKMVTDLEMDAQVNFIPGVSNEELCGSLPSYDLFVAHNDLWGISKSLIEALLAGLPTVHNKPKPGPVPEMQGGHVLLVDNSPEGYSKAIKSLIEDHDRREALGRKALAVAWEKWSPKAAEQLIVDIYELILEDC